MRDDFHERLLVVPEVPDLQLAVVEYCGKTTAKVTGRKKDRQDILMAKPRLVREDSRWTVKHKSRQRGQNTD